MTKEEKGSMKPKGMSINVPGMMLSSVHSMTVSSLADDISVLVFAPGA